MILAIRPEPGCSATVASGRELGLEIEGVPLFAIRAVAWQAPDPSSVDALLVGSANAIRHGGPDLAQYAGKPLHAVGEITAAAARDNGFRVASVGRGGLQGVIDALAPAPVRMLRLAGREHVALDIPAHIELTTRIVYESAALPLPGNVADRLARGALVLLHSAAAARHFAEQCERLAVERTRVRIAALGPRIAAAAGAGWAARASAPQPTDAALLALARDMGYPDR